MKYKLIISDYDGTMAPSGAKCTLDKETINAIKSYEDRGGKFVICTGRPYCSIKRLKENYTLKGAVATLQGAYICDIQSGTIILEQGLDKNTALEVLEKFKAEKDATPIVFIGENFYTERRDDIVAVYENADCVDAVLVNSLEELIKNAKVVGKIVLLIKPDDTRIAKIHEKYSKLSTEKVLYNYAVNYGYEAINPRFSKKEAVEFLIDYYGLTNSEVMTVGDSDNDIPLLSGAWHGVCVGDGKERLKKIAKEITVPVKDQPIKVLIEKYSKKG